MTKRDAGATRRRKERAIVGDRLQGVFVKCERLAAGGKEVRVFNISELGLGIDAALVAQAPPINEPLSAKLLVGRTVAPVQIRLVHKTPSILGMEFVDPTPLLRGAIQSYFEAELEGASLQPTVASGGRKLIYETDDGGRLEVGLVSANGPIDRFSIRVLGNSIDWDRNGGLRLVQNSRTEPVPEFLTKQLLKLVRSADRVDLTVRDQLEAVLAGTA